MKKRLSFLTSAPLIAGIFIIIYVGFGLVYLQRQSQSQELNAQMALMRSTLRVPEPDVAGLQAKLAAVNSETNGMLNALPNPEQGIDVYAALIDVARKSNVEVLSIEAAPPVVPKAGTSGNVSLPYSLGLRGMRADIMDFVYRLALGQDLLQGVEIRDIHMETSSNDGTNTATVDVYVHTWPADATAAPTPAQAAGSKK